MKKKIPKTIIKLHTFVAMSTAALNYSIWTGIVGVILEYYKRRGHVKTSTLLTQGFLDKGAVCLISTYLQKQNFPPLGNRFDANYIYNGILGAASQMLQGNRSHLNGAEEQILCALIGSRISFYWGAAFDVVTSNFGWVNNMFAGSSGYTNADVRSEGTPIPSMNSGANSTAGVNITNATMANNTAL